MAVSASLPAVVGLRLEKIFAQHDDHSFVAYLIDKYLTEQSTAQDYRRAMFALCLVLAFDSYEECQDVLLEKIQSEDGDLGNGLRLAESLVGFKHPGLLLTDGMGSSIPLQAVELLVAHCAKGSDATEQVLEIANGQALTHQGDEIASYCLFSLYEKDGISPDQVIDCLGGRILGSVKDGLVTDDQRQRLKYLVSYMKLWPKNIRIAIGTRLLFAQTPFEIKTALDDPSLDYTITGLFTGGYELLAEQVIAGKGSLRFQSPSALRVITKLVEIAPKQFSAQFWKAVLEILDASTDGFKKNLLLAVDAPVLEARLKLGFAWAVSGDPAGSEYLIQTVQKGLAKGIYAHPQDVTRKVVQNILNTTKSQWLSESTREALKSLLNP